MSRAMNAKAAPIGREPQSTDKTLQRARSVGAIRKVVRIAHEHTA